MLEKKERFVHFATKKPEEALRCLAYFDIVEFFGDAHKAIVKGYSCMFDTLRDIDGFKLGMEVKE